MPGCKVPPQLSQKLPPGHQPTNKLWRMSTQTHPLPVFSSGSTLGNHNNPHHHTNWIWGGGGRPNSSHRPQLGQKTSPEPGSTTKSTTNQLIRKTEASVDSIGLIPVSSKRYYVGSKTSRRSRLAQTSNSHISVNFRPQTLI